MLRGSCERDHCQYKERRRGRHPVPVGCRRSGRAAHDDEHSDSQFVLRAAGLIVDHVELSASARSRTRPAGDAAPSADGLVPHRPLPTFRTPHHQKRDICVACSTTTAIRHCCSCDVYVPFSGLRCLRSCHVYCSLLVYCCGRRRKREKRDRAIWTRERPPKFANQATLLYAAGIERAQTPPEKGAGKQLLLQQRHGHARHHTHERHQRNERRNVPDGEHEPALVVFETPSD